ncbi:Tetraheme cytochrome-c type, NapC/NirT cytochrome c [Magnetospira sp. QH-2]|nr:Tetraheme cytochrome-c type, NapC/NirT cytochrome c [Magnetospira sp. QH-2]
MRMIWNWLKNPGVRWGLIVGVVGTFVGIVGFNVVVAHTNTMEFCTSCHSMSYPLAEYKKSFHYKNTVGVQAGCPDCHVPHTYPDLLIAKVMAAKDVYGEIMGHIETPELYEKERLTMAKRVWAKMEATESRECRNCHDFEDMLSDEQGRRARRKHSEAQKKGGHCIQCHKGVVHEMPEGYEG